VPFYINGNMLIMKKIKVVILRNEQATDHLLWIQACEAFKDQLEYSIVDITKNSWFESIQSRQFDILLAKPGGLTAPYKQLYDERIYILTTVLGYPVFPSADEIFIYENKRFLSYWLKANHIPHPKTDVFYNHKEAEEFLQMNVFPIVGKTNIGASGSGVRILKNRKEALNYITQTFSGKGAPKRFGPNIIQGDLFKRGINYFVHPEAIIDKLDIYKTKRSDFQKDFVIFQEYIQHNFEWRVVRIGDSFFAHKKIKIGEKASGSLVKGYENPPLDLLNFVKRITDKIEFFSQAIDIFESERGYLVNEMQCIFGQSDPYQMLVDNKPGRYRFIEDRWLFEQGEFNKNESFNLRVEFILQKYGK
jgi:glutathione synthase/RimK-type ligase-like ATP-grasp enzyme